MALPVPSWAIDLLNETIDDLNLQFPHSEVGIFNFVGSDVSANLELSTFDNPLLCLDLFDWIANPADRFLYWHTIQLQLRRCR